ncbi:MAG: DUF21 domain-containing protein [Planctomycetes bacterium]|nr:DUF21 domain-containing protein [Planctomycetota bacterium]
MTLVFLLAAVVLLLLNAFFVLAEFAAVKVRPSLIDALIAQGNTRAKLMKHIQAHLDEYLSVCQVGITFASIGLGFVAEPAVVVFVQPLVEWTGWFSDGARWYTAHGIAFALSYILVSFLHILIGELVPKSIAIRKSQAAALWCALPLRFFHFIFYAPLWILNTSSNAVLRLMGLPPIAGHDVHSEDELRIIISQSHRGGLMSFRRLLFMENIFDFGELKVRDAMRIRQNVRVLRVDAPWSENQAIMREWRFSRYPLVDAAGRPLGIVLVKDLFLHHLSDSHPDLAKIARPFVGTNEDASLEGLLAEMQRRRIHAALPINQAGQWTGFITMEDIIEEIIGTVEDEFASDPPVFLGDVLTVGRVVLDLEADSIPEAIMRAFGRVPPDDLPMPAESLVGAVLEREKLVSTYLGYGIAMPHARLPRLTKPLLMFVRSPEGVPMPDRDEKVHLLFILLTPAGLPRIHQRLQARIAGILDSDFVDSRLREAATPAEVLEAVRTAEATAID